MGCAERDHGATRSAWYCARRADHSEHQVVRPERRCSGVCALVVGAPEPIPLSLVLSRRNRRAGLRSNEVLNLPGA